MLYILVKQDKTAFKVGVTIDESLNRVKTLHNIHTFNLEESFIVRASDQDVLQKLERQLLTEYKPYKVEFEETVDGKDEFLDIKVLKEVVEDIEYKAKRTHLGIAITKGINREKDVTPLVSEKKLIKTIQVYESDYKFFQRYSIVMGYKKGKKYPLLECFRDAMSLLVEKYPDLVKEKGSGK